MTASAPQRDQRRLDARTVLAPQPEDLVPIDRCQLCGGESRQLMFKEGVFSVVRCRTCQLVYVTPRLVPEALLAVYGEEYWRSDNPKMHGYADYQREAELYLKTYRRRLALVRRWLREHARVLDVGCAAGYFLRVVEALGCEVRGVEVSAPIAKAAVAALGPERVHTGTLDEAVAAMPLAPASFDLITLWDVIEHVPEPQQLLATVRSLLRPDGRLLLETQNVRSLWARLLGRRWHHYKHAEHLYHFDPDTIARLLQVCGFKVLHCGPGHAGKYVSFGFIAERAGRLGRIPGMLFAPLALLRGCSLYVNPRDELIVVAEKA